ncbi:hypothetical protein HHL22_14380 [Hymenobacter sp. RP-2-7]|uniref:Uncharacterized protein n=1 Tax=Hymenobacter polaris TaxID=2682546 RepID=A0A7Y0AFZ2_9BACT|nr:hypothetical protein [Hymenobacter polaris]NML66395.1 hypothetical protein [Hymenobacter polaris]
MKTLSKLGLLLALVVAGRYLRLTESAAFAKQEQPVARLVKADTLQFASYATSKMTLPLVPANQYNAVANPRSEPAYLVWY